MDELGMWLEVDEEPNDWVIELKEENECGRE
jgi:hypothetical protein